MTGKPAAEGIVVGDAVPSAPAIMRRAVYDANVFANTQWKQPRGWVNATIGPALDDPSVEQRRERHCRPAFVHCWKLCLPASTAAYTHVGSYDRGSRHRAA